MEAVTNLNTLKAMAKNGLIKLHEQTGKRVYWNGNYFKTYYIDDYDKPEFTYKGANYVVEYVSGSFYPYVFKVN